MHSNRIAQPRKPTAFILKLYEMLMSSEFQQVLTWTMDGSMFTILSEGELEDTVLPRYFKHSNLKSFARQLNIYGFRKARKAIASNSFQHPSFQRGSQQNLQLVRRKIDPKRELEKTLRTQEQKSEEFNSNLNSKPNCAQQMDNTSTEDIYGATCPSQGEFADLFESPASFTEKSEDEWLI